MIQTILYTIYSGYAYYTLMYVLGLKNLFPSKIEFIESTDKLANMVFAVAGIIYILNWGFEAYELSNSPSEYEYYAFRNRLLGDYMMFYWLQVIIYVVSTQLMWSDKIRQNNWARFMISILMIIPVERVLIIITSIHRDYIPSSWSYSWSSIILNYFFAPLIFIAFILVLTAVKKYLRLKS